MLRVSGIFLILSIFSATSAMATPKCSVTDAVVNTGLGAGIGATAGVAAVWTIGILAVPLTLGGSLWGAAAVTGPAIALGAKGGAFYGATAEAIDCGKAAKDKILKSNEGK